MGRSQLFRPESLRVECKRGMKLGPMPIVDLERTHGSESPSLTPVLMHSKQSIVQHWASPWLKVNTQQIKQYLTKII